MAWHDPITEFAPSALVGVGLVLAAPIVLPVLGGVFRPVAKSAIKGYLAVQDTVTEWAAETSEGLSDLVAEARAEQAAGPEAETRVRGTSPAGSPRKKSASSSASKTSE
jgi:hypothetical protein